MSTRLAPRWSVAAVAAETAVVAAAVAGVAEAATSRVHCSDHFLVSQPTWPDCVLKRLASEVKARRLQPRTSFRANPSLISPLCLLRLMATASGCKLVQRARSSDG